MFFFFNYPNDDSHTLETKVGNLILQCLTQNERILKDESIETTRLKADYWLPDGCNSLNWASNTAVEVKYTLTYSQLTRIASDYLSAMNKNIIRNLVIVVSNLIPSADYNEYVQSLSKLSVEVLSVSDLEKMIKKIQIEFPIQNNRANKDGLQKIQNDNIEKAKKAYEKSKHTWFLGAGLSMDANLPSWSQLLKELLKSESEIPYLYVNEHNADAISDQFGNSAIITGRYIFDGYRNAILNHLDNKYDKLCESDRARFLDDEANNKIVERIRKALYVRESYPSDLIKSVCKEIRNRYPEQIITYNYDDLLETELKQLNIDRGFYSIYNKNIPRYDVIPIYHVHGMIARERESPSLPVFSEKEYHHLYGSMHNWANVIQLHSLNSTTCFFVGFSMTDPNQRRLLDFASFEDFNTDPVDDKPHFVFLKKNNLKGEAYGDVNKENLSEIEYMMNCFGLNVIWYNDHKQLPRIIDYISGENPNKPNVV
jgi:hypothetical protein